MLMAHRSTMHSSTAGVASMGSPYLHRKLESRLANGSRLGVPWFLDPSKFLPLLFCRCFTPVAVGHVYRYPRVTHRGHVMCHPEWSMQEYSKMIPDLPKEIEAVCVVNQGALCLSLLLVWCAHGAHAFTIAGIRTARQMLTTRRWTRDLEAAASSCFKLLQLLWTACRLFDCALALSHPCLERKDLGEMKVSVEDYGSCCLLLGHVPKSMLPWTANWCCLCQDTHWQKWSASKRWRQPRWRTNTAAARGRRKLEHCKVTTASCLYIYHT